LYVTVNNLTRHTEAKLFLHINASTHLTEV